MGGGGGVTPLCGCMVGMDAHLPPFVVVSSLACGRVRMFVCGWLSCVCGGPSFGGGGMGGGWRGVVWRFWLQRSVQESSPPARPSVLPPPPAFLLPRASPTTPAAQVRSTSPTPPPAGATGSGGAARADGGASWGSVDSGAGAGAGFGEASSGTLLPATLPGDVAALVQRLVAEELRAWRQHADEEVAAWRAAAATAVGGSGAVGEKPLSAASGSRVPSPPRAVPDWTAVRARAHACALMRARAHACALMRARAHACGWGGA